MYEIETLSNYCCFYFSLMTKFAMRYFLFHLYVNCLPLRFKLTHTDTICPSLLLNTIYFKSSISSYVHQMVPSFSSFRSMHTFTANIPTTYFFVYLLLINFWNIWNTSICICFVQHLWVLCRRYAILKYHVITKVSCIKYSLD